MKKLFNILIILLFGFLTTAVTGSWATIDANPSFIAQEEEDSMDMEEEGMEEEETHNEGEESYSPDEGEEESEEKSEDDEGHSWY